jgi:hypothetical protein
MQRYTTHKKIAAYVLIPILIAYTVYFVWNFSELAESGILSIIGPVLAIVMGAFGVLMVLTGRSAKELLSRGSQKE